jgi:acetamidase/formamidase
VRTLHHRDGHHGWDRDVEPLLTVGPGDEVELVLADGFGGQLPADATAADVAALDLGLANPLTGPVRVAGAEPGDALGVELLDVGIGARGWTTLIPGFGLLADEFPDPYVLRSTIAGDHVAFADLARLPRWPFLGTVGLAPAAPGVHSVIPPRRVGGNLDTRDVRPGAILWLPVEVPGALLSAGDPHAVQGDGEVCGTAVETTATARLRLHLRRGAAPADPQVGHPLGSPLAPPVTGRRVVTTGVGPDLMVSARDATRAMVEHLGKEAGLDPRDAYALCSVIGNLRLTEVVDAPNWVVAMDLDLGVLD